MKRAIAFIFLIFAVYYCKSQSITEQLLTPTNLISFSSVRNFSRITIDYNQSDKIFMTTQGKFGEPEIPVIQKKYVLPINADNISVSVTSFSSYQYNGDYLLYPEQPPIPLNYENAPKWVEPNEEIYNSDEDYPGKKIELSTIESSGGYKIITLNLFPVSYKPFSKEVKCFTNISFTVNYSINNTNLIIPERISVFSLNNS